MPRFSAHWASQIYGLRSVINVRKLVTLIILYISPELSLISWVYSFMPLIFFHNFWLICSRI